MASPKSTFTPNQRWFDTILRTTPIEALVDESAERILAAAQASAPVKTGEYRDALTIEHHESRYRRVTEVVGTDPKTLLIESRTGNLARAVKAGRR